MVVKSTRSLVRVKKCKHDHKNIWSELEIHDKCVIAWQSKNKILMIIFVFFVFTFLSFNLLVAQKHGTATIFNILLSNFWMHNTINLERFFMSWFKWNLNFYSATKKANDFFSMIYRIKSYVASDAWGVIKMETASGDARLISREKNLQSDNQDVS